MTATLALLILAGQPTRVRAAASPTPAAPAPEAAKEAPAREEAPAEPKAKSKCTVLDAMPILSKDDYQDEVYEEQKIKQRPVTYRESFNASNTTKVRIESHGCTDIGMDINIDFGPPGEDKGAGELLDLSGDIIKDFHLADRKHSLFNKKTFDDIASNLAKAKGSGAIKDKLICLSKVESKCLTDITVSVSKPKVKIHYVDRP